MKMRTNVVKGLLFIVFLFSITESGCALFKKRPLLVPREAGDTLVEITDPKQLPKFSDDYNKDSLLRSLDNSLEYFKRVKSNPYGFQMADFSHTNLENTLRFFREGFVRCRNN